MADRFRAADMPGFATIAVLAFVALYLPIVDAGDLPASTAPIRLASGGGWSLRWYGIAWANGAVQEAALRSFVLAATAAAVSTTVATLAALGTTRTARFRGETFIYAMINQPLMVPEIVTAVALLIFFAAIKVSTGLYRPWLSDPGALGVLRAVRLSADPGAAGKHGPDAGNRCGRPLRRSLADLSPHHPAAAAAGDHGRGDAGVRHLSG